MSFLTLTYAATPAPPPLPPPLLHCGCSQCAQDESLALVGPSVKSITVTGGPPERVRIRSVRVDTGFKLVFGNNVLRAGTKFLGPEYADLRRAEARRWQRPYVGCVWIVGHRVDPARNRAARVRDFGPGRHSVASESSATSGEAAAAAPAAAAPAAAAGAAPAAAAAGDRPASRVGK
jgi:hypothetical protein